MLSGRPCNFHILSLNNHANPSTDVFSVVGIKCTILVNWSTTTRIESYSCAKGNLVMKSADIYAQGFSGIEFGINLSAGSSMWFLFFWQELHPFTYCFTSFVTFGHQKFLVTSFTIFYYPPCPPTGMSWCNLIISTLNLLSLDTYTFPSLYMIPSTSFYSLSLNILTPAHFSSSTAFTCNLVDHLLLTEVSNISNLRSCDQLYY